MAIALEGTVQSGTTGDGGDVTMTWDGTPAVDMLNLLLGGIGGAGTEYGPHTDMPTYTEIASDETDDKAGAWYRKLDSTDVTRGNVKAEGGGDAADGVASGHGEHVGASYRMGSEEW